MNDGLCNVRKARLVTCVAPAEAWAKEEKKTGPKSFEQWAIQTKNEMREDMDNLD